MLLKIFTPKCLNDLRKILDDNDSLLAAGAQTSTVIPFSKLNFLAENNVKALLDLSCMPKKIKLVGDVVHIQGSVSWQELRQELSRSGLDVGCFPTDQTALVLAGLATSATGERCFSYGTLRDHCLEIEYINSSDEINVLTQKELAHDFLSTYQRKYKKYYQNFKNGPYPKLENEIDLMIGLEGQLGIILGAKLKVFPRECTQNILVPIKSLNTISSIIEWSKSRNSEILSFEFFDKRSLDFYDDSRLNGNDYLSFEVKDGYLEEFINHCSKYFKELDFDLSVTLSSSQFHEMRVAIPRMVNEFLSKNNMIKIGTDAQVDIENINKLFEIYENLSKKNITSILFGHIGDCHLHFNFLPKKYEVEECHQLLADFYRDIKSLNGSPFAEHGIGIIKKKYIEQFYDFEILKVFKLLKAHYDPKNKFFPQGFLSYGQ